MSTARFRGVLAAAALWLGPLAAHAEPNEEIAALSRSLNTTSREQKLLHARLSFAGLARVDRDTLHFADARLHSGGKPLLIHLWSVDCKPCVKEMPALGPIMAHLYEESGLRVVFIAEDLPGPLTEFLRTSAAKLPVVEHWVSGPSSNMRIELRDNAQPLTLLLDGNFVVRHAFVGPLTKRRNELFTVASRLLRSLSPHPAKS